MTPQPYPSARSDIRDGDIVAWEGRGIVSRLIALGTGGRVTHVGVAAWWGRRLMVLEAREFRGGRASWLSRELNSARLVRIFRPTLPIESHRHAEMMHWLRGAAGAGYNWRGVIRYGRRVLRRWFGLPMPPVRPDTLSDGHRYCSELASAGYRVAGLDPRPDLEDAATSPEDLVRSTAFTEVLVIDPHAQVAA